MNEKTKAELYWLLGYIESAVDCRLVEQEWLDKLYERFKRLVQEMEVE